MLEENITEKIYECANHDGNILLEDFEREVGQLVILFDGLVWQAAEPDIGIMYDYLDDWSETYYIGEVAYTDRTNFITALIDNPILIDSQYTIESAIENTVEEWAARQEQY